MPIDPEEIDALLASSRQAHLEYREHAPRMVPGNPRPVPSPGNWPLANAAFWRACRLRVEAQALDPDHTAPAWTTEPANFRHDALLTFYGEQLGR